MLYNGERLIVHIVGWSAAFALAGVWGGWFGNAPREWIFFALFFGFALALIVALSRYNYALLSARIYLGGAFPLADDSVRPGWHEVLYPLGFVFPWVPAIALLADPASVFRLTLPFELQVMGIAVVLCSFLIILLTIRTTSYLSTLTGVQEEGGHKAVSPGLYYYVRHPMYFAMVLLLIGMSFFFNSWYPLLMELVFLFMFGERMARNESRLQAELPGYEDYMAQVKYRLVPYVW